MGVPSLLTRQMAAMDARMICAVVDQHGGGGIIYKGSDPAYYLLAGECYAAISDNQEARISAVRGEDLAPVGWEPSRSQVLRAGSVSPSRLPGSFLVLCKEYD